MIANIIFILNIFLSLKKLIWMEEKIVATELWNVFTVYVNNLYIID